MHGLCQPEGNKPNVAVLNKFQNNFPKNIIIIMRKDYSKLMRSTTVPLYKWNYRFNYESQRQQILLPEMRLKFNKLSESGTNLAIPKIDLKAEKHRSYVKSEIKAVTRIINCSVLKHPTTELNKQR